MAKPKKKTIEDRIRELWFDNNEYLADPNWKTKSEMLKILWKEGFDEEDTDIFFVEDIWKIFEREMLLEKGRILDMIMKIVK